jgi:hypothetical protein
MGARNTTPPMPQLLNLYVVFRVVGSRPRILALTFPTPPIFLCVKGGVSCLYHSSPISRAQS